MKKTILAILLLHLIFSVGNGKELSAKKINVFIEGNTFDFNYIRNNTPFADFVNDPKVSEIHIIFSKQQTGGGGNQFTLDYYNSAFEGIPNFKLTCTTYSYDTDDLIRQKLIKTLHSGLLLYLNERDALNQVKISGLEQTKNIENTRISEQNDPWKQWVFRLNVDGGLNGEEQKQNLNYSFAARANKVTDKWKIINEYDYDRKEGTIKKDDGTTIHTLKIDQDADVKLVLSINQHWSYGLFLQGTQSTYKNIKMAFEAMPAIQYNFYNWKESDRRKFTFSYYTGPEFNKYYETTILNKTSEGLWRESVAINLNRVETWGELDVWLEGGHYFPNFENYYYNAGIDLSCRVSKGFSVYFKLQTESIHNQIYLPASELSNEELLLNTRKLPTSYEYAGKIGIRFQFGSIYNNVVNERL